MNDSVVCYSTIGDVPKKLWASNVGFGYEHAPSMQMEKDGVVFSSTKEGLIFALEASTGQVLWKHKIGNSLINTVIPSVATRYCLQLPAAKWEDSTVLPSVMRRIEIHPVNA